MTITADQQARDIAKGLTKAQREQILRGTVSGDCSMRTVRALIGKGVMHLRIDSPDGKHGFVENTPLGLQVRAILQEQGNG